MTHEGAIDAISHRSRAILKPEDLSPYIVQGPVKQLPKENKV